MAAATQHVIHYGNPNAPANEWVPFEFEEPGLGKQAQGEITVARPAGSTGTLFCGFWRTGPTTQGSQADGSHSFLYTATGGDETAVVIEGTGRLILPDSGKVYPIGPGSVISHPKGLQVRWETDGPFFKKFFALWNGTGAVADAPRELAVANTRDDPEDGWTPHRFQEPDSSGAMQDLEAGELYFLRTSGSSGTMLTGIWRAGKGFPASDVDAKGTVMTPYSGSLGDETMLLLEGGNVEVVETANGKKHTFQTGDVVGLTAGMPITYISKGPFSKKLFLITQDK